MVAVQKGFTLIELVTVIVILGILAAVAFPKFQSLSGSAQQAVVQGGEAAFISAAVITLAKNNGTVPTAASVILQMNLDPNISVTGTCPSAVVVKYAAPSTASVTIPTASLTGFCNG